MNITKKAFLAVVSLAMIFLMLTPAVNADNPVTRPFYISGQITLSPDGGSVISDEGVATHLGRFYLIDQDLYTYTYVVSNGDEISWMIIDWDMTNFPIIKGTMIFTGGTGRFENVNGYFEFSWDLITGFYTGEGTIAY